MTNDSSFLPWKQASGGALLDLERRADRALSGLVPVSQNVYNLILRDYYEGKYTGWKRGLIFDGFLDGSMIENLSEGFGRSTTKHMLFLDRDGGPYRESKFNTYTKTPLAAGESRTETWVVDRLGPSSSIQIYLAGSATLEISNDTGTYHKSFDRSSPGSEVAEVSFPFTTDDLDPGDVYTFKLTAKTPLLVCGASSGGFGWQILMGRPVRGETGIMTGKPFTLNGDYTQARAWVKCSVCPPPVLSLQDAAGEWVPMELTGQISMKSFSGEDCTEYSYLLNVPKGTRNVTFRMEVSGYANLSVKVFDYGVMAI